MYFDFDIVILSAPAYMEQLTENPLVVNAQLEDQLIADAMQRLGLRVTRKSWDDSTFDWATTKCALFRSTWDYINRVTAFKAWLQETSDKTQFINSKMLIDWNMDKHYLQQLQHAGVHIPKTHFIEKGSRGTLQQMFELAQKQHQFNCQDLVLKPCISGGARHTYKIGTAVINEYEEIYAGLIANESFLLQEFQQHIVDNGEISMMVFNGNYTHAVLKLAKSGDFRVQDDFGGSVQEYFPSKEEIRFAETTVRAAPEMPMYARVDIFRDNYGKLALAELEIFEPELWFRLYPKAADVLAEQIKSVYFN